MKKTYVEPELEIIEFETEDIMQSSGVTYNDALDAWDSLWGSKEAW